MWRRELGDRRDNINQKLQYYPEEAFNYNSPGDHEGANTHLLTVVCPGPDRISQCETEQVLQFTIS